MPLGCFLAIVGADRGLIGCSPRGLGDGLIGFVLAALIAVQREQRQQRSWVLRFRFSRLLEQTFALVKFACCEQCIGQIDADRGRICGEPGGFPQCSDSRVVTASAAQGIAQIVPA